MNGGECLIGSNIYDESKENVKSLMWTIPFGQKYSFALPDLDFEIGNDALPFQLNVDAAKKPVLEVSGWILEYLCLYFLYLAIQN